ncbi:hypothetical protein PBI_121Q_339 [Escherichia phage 121Q]|uniref:Uncharacterized protein n=1 Tax=Escherichia phage 121Q TaxID=1555202 RepID=A0A097EXQ1_9CAUD|nr:hypothetical protein PBI_121Q_339 [Escherichia phage 121Q]AIT14229.1 hypothetical protein PBI_121Q_339 [Escherichia phage 121Q]
MKVISNQEYLALFRKNNHKYMALDSRTDISELEKNLLRSEMIVLTLLGTQHQERTVNSHIEILKKLIQEKL